MRLPLIFLTCASIFWARAAFAMGNPSTIYLAGVVTILIAIGVASLFMRTNLKARATSLAILIVCIALVYLAASFRGYQQHEAVVDVVIVALTVIFVGVAVLLQVREYRKITNSSRKHTGSKGR
jgi:NADH:ubiquinone oxidoreductase subunit K